jgi:hypothetical protein
LQATDLASGVTKGASQDEFDLPVQAAKVIVRPALQSVEHRPIDAQEKRLAVRHIDIRGPALRRLGPMRSVY